MGNNNAPKGILTRIVFAVIGFMFLMGTFFIVKPGDVAVKTRMGKLVGSYGEGPQL